MLHAIYEQVKLFFHWEDGWRGLALSDVHSFKKLSLIAGSGKTFTTRHLSHYLASSLFERADTHNLVIKVKFVEVYLGEL